MRLVFAAALLQVKLADRLDHPPGLSALSLDLVDQRQTCHSIAIGCYLSCITIFDDLRKVLRGSLQLILLVMHHSRETNQPQFFWITTLLWDAAWNSTRAILLACSSWPLLKIDKTQWQQEDPGHRAGLIAARLVFSEE